MSSGTLRSGVVYIGYHSTIRHGVWKHPDQETYIPCAPDHHEHAREQRRELEYSNLKMKESGRWGEEEGEGVEGGWIEEGG